MTEPTVTQEPDDRRRRTALLAGGAVAALVVMLVLVRLLSSGGGGGSTSSTTQPSPRPSGATTTTTAPPGSAPSETFEVFTTKNPFLPLRSAGGGAAASGSAAAGSAAPGGTAGGASGAGSTSASRGGAGGGGSAGNTAEPRRSARVALQDVFVEGGKVKANVRVNDTVHKVASGEVFATNFKVVSLSQSDRCGRFLVGDEPFRLCKGEQLLK
jgi:hypothetical protein